MSSEQSSSDYKSCSHCGSTDLYSRHLPSGGSHGPYLLQGLGSFLHFAEFEVITCCGCGLTHLFAEPEARRLLQAGSEGWKRVSE